MTLEEKRKYLKLTYQNIATKAGLTRSGVFRIIRQPWRTTLKSFLKIAKLLSVKDDDAKQEWSASKSIFYNNKLQKKMNNGTTS